MGCKRHPKYYVARLVFALQSIEPHELDPELAKAMRRNHPKVSVFLGAVATEKYKKPVLDSPFGFDRK
jgi:hypothetical protein